jgi:hypothetical protein
VPAALLGAAFLQHVPAAWLGAAVAWHCYAARLRAPACHQAQAAELREDKGRQAKEYEQAAAALQQQVAQLTAELQEAGQASAALREQLAGLRSKRASAVEGQAAELARWAAGAGAGAGAAFLQPAGVCVCSPASWCLLVQPCQAAPLPLPWHHSAALAVQTPLTGCPLRCCHRIAAEKEALSQQVARLQQEAEEAGQKLEQQHALGGKQAAEEVAGSSAPLIKALHGPGGAADGEGMISVDAAELAELQAQVVELRDALQVGCTGGAGAVAAAMSACHAVLVLDVLR